MNWKRSKGIKKYLSMDKKVYSSIFFLNLSIIKIINLFLKCFDNFNQENIPKTDENIIIYINSSYTCTLVNEKGRKKIK